MFDSYTQTLQDQIGQLGKLLGVQQPAGTVAEVQSRFDCVDGIEGARSFLQQKMLASTRHIVWDNNEDTFYVLQKDANGTPSRIQVCRYTVELEPTMEEKYVTKEDFNALVAKLDALITKEANNG